MEELPNELLDQCFSNVDIAGLKSLRLTSRQSNAVATPHLYQNVLVRPAPATGERACHILSDKRLNPLVVKLTMDLSKHAIVVLDDKVGMILGDDDHDVSTLPNGHCTVLESLGCFPNLESVAVKFDAELPGFLRLGPRGETTKLIAQPLAWRYTLLGMLFQGLTNDEHPASKLRSLAIDNLLAAPMAPLSCAGARLPAVLSRLDALELRIARERDEYHPDQILHSEDPYAFYESSLSSFWLSPTQSNLKHLKLDDDTYWGYLRFVDFRDLHFPLLRSLTLRKYTFTHDWQLDWILSHGKTLRSLVLEDCPIIHDALIHAAAKPDRMPPTHDEVCNPEPRTFSSWEYKHAGTTTSVG